MTIDAVAQREIETLIGESIDSEQGLSLSQQDQVGALMLSDSLAHLKLSTAPELYADLMLPKLASRRHWAFFAPTNAEPNTPAQTLPPISKVWFANSFRVLLTVEERERYSEFRRAHRMEGFAGSKQKNTRFPSCNTWWEVAFPPGKYPSIVPLRDIGVQTPVVKIKRMAIHALHQFCVDPLPGNGEDTMPEARELYNSPMFLRTASIIAFLEDAIGEIHTYAGKVVYGSNPDADGLNGAVMWRVINADMLVSAVSGQNPYPVETPSMSHLSQFVCTELARMIAFFDHSDYDALRAQYVISAHDGADAEYSEDTSA